MRHRKLFTLLLPVLSIIFFLLIFELALDLVDYRQKSLFALQDKDGFFTKITNNSFIYSEVPFFTFVNDTSMPVDISQMEDGFEFNNILYHNRSDFLKQCSEVSKGNYLIIFVGDSVMRGVRRPVTAAIQGNMSCRNISILTFAQHGYNLNQVLGIVKHDAIPCRPDMVVYGFFQNDVTENYLIRSGSSIKEGMFIYSRPRWFKDIPFRKFLEYFKSYWFFENSVSSLIMRLSGDDGIKDNAVSNLIFETKAKDRLEEMHRLVRESGSDFIMINFPYLDSDEYDTFSFPIEFSSEHDIPLIDIRDGLMLRKINSSDIRQESDDYAHYNGYGSLVVADIIAREFSGRLSGRICDSGK